MLPWNAPILDSLRRPDLPHALLIHGVRGVGKLALAEQVAQLVLCEATDQAAKPCGVCDGCRWFLGGNHPDFRRVEPEALAPARTDAEDEEGAPTSKRTAKPSTEIKVDQIRELAAFLNLGSHRGRRRLALVHPAEDMNPNSANALLKGLEEPPGGAMFILVTHRPASLLPTIRSLCVALPVPLPPRPVALEWLQGQGVKEADRWLAYAGGAPLSALAYASSAETVDRLNRAIASRGDMLIDDRESLEALAEALQKTALDQSLMAFGLPAKYRTASEGPGSAQARAWLKYAREMGQNRLLARHPVNTRLFAAEMMAGLPPNAKSR